MVMAKQRHFLFLRHLQRRKARAEKQLIHPSAKFITQDNLTDAKVFKRFSLDEFPNCFKEYADLLPWHEYLHKTLDARDAPCFKSFVGVKINARYNCIDRHLNKYKNKTKTTLPFVSEPENEKN
jgi:acetyl-CoA synthetase